MASDINLVKFRLNDSKPTGFTEFITGAGTITYDPVLGVKQTFAATTTATDDLSLDQNTGQNLTNSAVCLEVTGVPTSVTNNVDAQIRLEVNASNSLYWEFEGTFLRCWKNVAGTVTQVGTDITWDLNVHRWLRIREGTYAGGTAGTVYFDWSTDGQSWTNHASTATPITITAIKIIINTFSLAIESGIGYFSARNLNWATDDNIAKNITLQPAPFTPGLRR